MFSSNPLSNASPASSAVFEPAKFLNSLIFLVITSLFCFKRADVLNIFSPIACVLAITDGALIADNVGKISISIDLPAVSSSSAVNSLPAVIDLLPAPNALPIAPNKPSPTKPIAASVAMSFAIEPADCFDTPAVASTTSSKACPPPAPKAAPIIPPNRVPIPGTADPIAAPFIAPVTPPISSGAIPPRSAKS